MRAVEIDPRALLLTVQTEQEPQVQPIEFIDILTFLADR